MINNKLTVAALALCAMLTTSSIFANDDCTSIINQDKNTFLNSLRAGASQIYQTLHNCAQNNFCASYSGNAACLPTLNNYTSDAAYYAAAQRNHASSAAANLSAEQQQALQQNLQTSDAVQQAESAQPQMQEKKSSLTTQATEKKQEKSSGGGIYDNINF